MEPLPRRADLDYASRSALRGSSAAAGSV